MRVLLVNGWSDDNKGDAAIVQGLLSLLRKAWPLESSTAAIDPLEIGLASMIGETGEAGLQRHYRHTAPPGCGVTVFPPLLPSELSITPRWRRRIVRVLHLLRAGLLLALGRSSAALPLLGARERETYQAFCGADLVIAKGGHQFFSTGSVSSLLGLFMNLFPMLLALRLKKTVVLYAQSIGPVRGRPHRALLSWALRRCARVLVREPLSLEVAKELMGAKGARNGEQPALVWDTAFSVFPQPFPPELEKRLPPEFVALTVRQWNFPYDAEGGKERYGAYLGAMAEIARRVHQEWGIPVVLIPQVIGPSGMENDYFAWDDLGRVLAGTGAGTWVEMREDLTPGQLMTLYGRARLVVGTRFHSVILALAAGAPAVSISYHGFKSSGIMRMLGLGRFSFEMDGLEVDGLWDAMRELDGEGASIRERWSRKLEEIRAESLATARKVMHFSNTGEALCP